MPLGGNIGAMNSRTVRRWAIRPLRHTGRPIASAFRHWPIPSHVRVRLAYWLFGGWALELLLLLVYTLGALLWLTTVASWLIFLVTISVAMRLMAFPRWSTPDTKELSTDAE